MLLGIPVTTVVTLIGKGGTHYKTLRTVLDSYPEKGRLGDITQRRRSNVPMWGTHLVKVVWSKKPWVSHFVILHNGKVYDPAWESGGIPYDSWLDTQRTYRNLPQLDVTSWATWTLNKSVQDA
jgi:hypothetical protein